MYPSFPSPSTPNLPSLSAQYNSTPYLSRSPFAGNAVVTVYFSNLKSYLLISYVSPSRLGIFTEMIVSARPVYPLFLCENVDADSISFIIIIFFFGVFHLPPLFFFFPLLSIACDVTREGNCAERTTFSSWSFLSCLSVVTLGRILLYYYVCDVCPYSFQDTARDQCK